MILRLLLFLVSMTSLAAEPVKELVVLKWMAGTWEHESEGTTVRMTGRWVDGGRFLERNFEIKLGNEPPKKMRQTVFWDPAKKQIRSWGVLSDGGLEEAVWRMREGSLEVRREITHADGKRGKAVNHWTVIDGKNCVWSSSKRSLDGKKIPDIPATSLEKE